MNYSIVSLSPAQLEERRVLLDQAGYIGFVSPIVIGIAVGSYRSITCRQGQTPIPAFSSTALQLLQRRITWILNQPLTSEFGQLRSHLLGLVYACWLLLIIFRGTGNDYMHLTKAFGHVAISQLPFQYLLAVKSPWNPIQLATGLAHEDLNDFHRLFGRVVHVLLTIHAVLYLRFFAIAGLLSRRIKDRDVRLGLIAFWAFNLLGLLALPLFRRKAYHKLFYRSHVLLSAFIVPMLFFHVPYTQKYILQAGSLYLINGILRKLNTSNRVRATSEGIVGTSLLRLRVDAAATTDILGWDPGQHVYIKQSNNPMLPRTPFTAVKWPRKGSSGAKSTEGVIELVIRNSDGPQTHWLASNKEIEVLVEGPYGEAKRYVRELLLESRKSERVMLVAGGVGATYTLPIYLRLLEARKSSDDAHFIWFVRSLREANWGIEEISKALCPVDASIYLTRPTNAKAIKEFTNGKAGLKIITTGAKLKMREVVDNVFTGAGKSNSTPDHSRVYVFACGPPGMSTSLRREVGKFVRQGREVKYHEERFGLGSS